MFTVIMKKTLGNEETHIEFMNFDDSILLPKYVETLVRGFFGGEIMYLGPPEACPFKNVRTFPLLRAIKPIDFFDHQRLDYAFDENLFKSSFTKESIIGFLEAWENMYISFEQLTAIRIMSEKIDLLPD